MTGRWRSVDEILSALDAIGREVRTLLRRIRGLGCDVFLVDGDAYDAWVRQRLCLLGCGGTGGRARTHPIRRLEIDG